MEDPLIYDLFDETSFLETSHEFSLPMNFDIGEGGNPSIEQPSSKESRDPLSPPKGKGAVSLSTAAASNGLYPTKETFDLHPDDFSCHASGPAHDFPQPKQRIDKNLKRRHEDEARNVRMHHARSDS